MKRSQVESYERQGRVIDTIAVVFIVVACLVVIGGVLLYVGGVIDHFYSPH